MITHEQDAGSEHETAAVEPRRRPRPGGSLVAAASRVTSRSLDRTKPTGAAQDWQEDAWDMFDKVGEQHFLSTTLANRCGQARLYTGRVSEDPTEPPEPVTDGKAADVFAAFDGQDQSPLITRLSANLFVAGDGWIVGIPKSKLPSDHLEQPADARGTGGTPLRIPPGDDAAPGPVPQEESAPVFGPDGESVLALSDLDWRMLSVSEIEFKGKTVQLQLGSAKEDAITVSPDDIFLIRVWRPHPRKWWEADSPTRAVLPVLRELVGLTMHVSAQVDSRLAGAGVFLVPQSAQDALLARMGDPSDREDDADPFTEMLVDGMMKPIQDRSNASAFVPLVFTVPDEAADKFKHISFSSPLDAEARNLREEAIRRLALGQDCPPEILLGVAGMNHWGAWLVREDTITTHVEPPLALICDALTSQFLRPVLIQQGMSEEEAEQYVVWYDVDHLIMRPNLTADAVTLHQEGVLSDAALRDAAGFSEQDAPSIVDPAAEILIEMIKEAPALAADPGIPALMTQIQAILAGQTPATGPAPRAAEEPPPSGEDVDLPADDGTAEPQEGAEGPPGLAAAATRGLSTGTATGTPTGLSISFAPHVEEQDGYLSQARRALAEAALNGARRG